MTHQLVPFGRVSSTLPLANRRRYFEEPVHTTLSHQVEVSGWTYPGGSRALEFIRTLTSTSPSSPSSQIHLLGPFYKEGDSQVCVTGKREPEDPTLFAAVQRELVEEIGLAFINPSQVDVVEQVFVQKKGHFTTFVTSIVNCIPYNSSPTSTQSSEESSASASAGKTKETVQSSAESFVHQRRPAGKTKETLQSSVHQLHPLGKTKESVQLFIFGTLEQFDSVLPKIIERVAAEDTANITGLTELPLDGFA